MDFSTDDNSYRSIQAAADFTSLVQVGLMGEAGIEWVERSQISLARQEFGLAGMEAAGGMSPLRRGRMLGADWLVTGHFSSDDQSHSALSVQVIELKHADVIAEATLTLPDSARSWSQLDPNQVAFVTGSVQSLFEKARIRQQEVANRARVAFLFLADTSSWPESDRGAAVLSREFADGLERATATNGRIRLVRFPKAYQSTDESEMVVDGIIEAGQDAWSRTADLYVWGAYSVTNARTSGRMESRLGLVLNLWDGVSQPVALKDSLTLGAREHLPPERASELINRLIGEVVAGARPQRSEGDSTVVRQQIADSIVKSYLAMTGRGRSQVGLHNREKLAQAVHMLETACYFDPDNAEARALWLTCRYGWWIDFGFAVKNQFWTKWRRSRAWGKYVDRFGLSPIKVELPFPYHRPDGLAEAYVRSLDDVVRLFPQWDSVAEATEDAAEEEQSRRQGVHTILMEAEYHGFPKQMPAELTMKWKGELKHELAQRKQRVTAYSQAQASSTNDDSAKPLVRSAGVVANQTGLPVPQKPVAVNPAQRSTSGVSRMVTAPAWLKSHMSIYGMFRLFPPNALPHEPKPEVQRIEFPPQFEIKVIRQLAYHHDRLWILAMDERSSPSSAATPDLSGETLDKRNRLWCLEAAELKPDLFKADALPARINSFLLYDGHLWLAGDAVGVMDLNRRSYRRFGLTEGLALKEVEALAVVAGRTYAAGDSFKLSSYDPAASHWNDVPLSARGGMSHGADTPYLLAGHQRWLGYAPGSTLFCDLVAGSWTNLAQLRSARCIAADGSMFWIGAEDGLHCYAAGTQTLRNWQAPIFIQSPMISLMGGGYFGGNATLPQNRLEELDAQIRGLLGKMKADRDQAHAARLRQKESLDPFRFNTRVPGKVAALLHDGDFLWLGVDNYFGSYLLLLHKPSLSLVAGYRMAVRDRISSLAVSEESVWVGTAYGDNSLLRLRKDAFLSVPRHQWVSLTITPEERRLLVQSMSNRDQALYAFFAGDDRRVVQLLGGLNPDKASLEEMFLLAWNYDASGVDDPQQTRFWYEQIRSRHPDSPWASYALAALLANDVTHDTRAANALALAKFDRNNDGKLDESERGAMRRDPAFAQVQNSALEKKLRYDMQQIVQRYDQNGDLKLNEAELKFVRQQIASHLFVRKERPDFQSRSRLLDPLISDRVPPAGELLPRYDKNKDANLDADELGVLAAEIQKEKE